MKRIKQALLSTLTLAALIFTTTAPSFATSGGMYYPLTATPLPSGSTVVNGSDTITSTQDAPTGDWTTSGTTEENVMYTLTIDSSLTCLDGSGAPTITAIGSLKWITAANPDDASDSSTAFNYVAPTTSGIYQFAPGGAGGSNSSGSEVNTGYEGGVWFPIYTTFYK